MQIQFAKKLYEFRPWRDGDGKVFNRTFAIDTETTLIDDKRPWIVPAYVLGAAFDGQNGYFVSRDRIGAFLAAHEGVKMIMHFAPFDLGVLNVVAPAAKVYDRLDRNEVYDTQLLHRLFVLGSVGHTATGKGESTLEYCAERYLGVSLPKDVKDTSGKDVRLSYGQWLTRPPGEIERPYLEYLASDVIATHRVFRVLRRKLTGMLKAASGNWGFVSKEWLREQVRAWGLQTHHIQLKAAVVLRAITANGLTLNTVAQEVLASKLEKELQRLREILACEGYLPGQPGSGKALQAILRRLEAADPEVKYPRTRTNKYSTSSDALSEYAERAPFLKTMLEHAETQKLLNCFVGKMRKAVIHPSFNVLARTGRTTSHGELNAQNLPRNDAVRGCFIPSAGHVYIKADYAMIELATLSQAVTTQFGLHSRMGDAINAGKDLHRLVAAKVTGKPESEVTDEERQQAKPINFGKPGAMGNATLKQYARASYGIDLSEGEVETFSDAWFDLFPEMNDYLYSDSDLGLEVAKVFDLTPDAHYEHTSKRNFYGHSANAFQTERPHAMLGGMLLKVLKEVEPVTQSGKLYDDADLDFFWTRVEAHLDVIPTNLQQSARNRQPSLTLQRAVMRLVGFAPVFTLTGRLRAKASFAARRNTVFQGLASDGAKLALWKLWRAGYRLVNFIHDEVLVEVPAHEDLRDHAELVRQLMIEGMTEVVPDIRVEVEYAACDRWYKKAKPVTAADGRGLDLWRPPEPKKK